jgi:glucokinase
MILVGDVGGTKTHLRLHDGADVLLDAVLPSDEHASLEDVVEAFLHGAHAGERPRIAVLGVAGPVDGTRCITTNLPWKLDARALEAILGIQHVVLINDFAAAALGVPHVPSELLVTLKPGHPRSDAPLAVLGAGTGLGEAILFPQRGHFKVLPGEGSHGDFGPRDEEDDAVAVHLRKKYGRVSWERVVSGLGLVDLYAFYRDRLGHAAGPRLEHGQAVAAAADEGDPAAVAALRLFVRAYGAEAGNLALRGLTRGGVYLAGGIAPKILSWLQDGAFVHAFGDKGRLAHTLADVPVHVVMARDVALRGALAEAERLLGDFPRGP